MLSPIAQVITSRKLCVLNPHHSGSTIGGAEVQMSILADEAVRRGWRVQYVSRVEELANLRGGRVELVPFETSGNRKRDMESMVSLLKEIDADVYYQRGRKLWTSFVGEFARRTGKPFVFAVSMDIDCQAHKIHFRRSGSIIDLLKRSVRGRQNRTLDRLTLEGMRRASLILAQSRHQVDLLRKNLGLDGVICRNVHPVPPEQEIRKSDPPVVLWLASVKTWKRPEIFLDVARRLRHLNCRFVLAGRLAEPSYRRVLDLAEQELPGFSYLEDVPFDRSNQLLAEASIFVNTSRADEGFPNTYVQAWLRRTPTVALQFDPDGVIDRERLGFRAGDADRLCGYLRELLENVALREDMGARARDYAIEHHGLERSGDRFFELLESTF